MWSELQRLLFLSPLHQLPMRKSRLRRRLLVLLPSTWNDVHSQSSSLNVDLSDSEMMEQTLQAQSEPRSLTEIKKRSAWHLCVKSALSVLAALTALSAFDTTPSLAASVNISCVQDYTTGECTDVGDSANRAVNVNVVAGGGGGGGTSSTFGAAFPATGTAAGFSDGTNMQPGRTVDADTGAGTVNVQGVNLLKRAAGGPVEAGTAADPLRIDPTGTTPQPVTGTFFQATQPVSGTVTADTELPAAAVLTDANANPTTPIIGSATLGFNGATFERVRTQGDTTDAVATEACCHIATTSHSYGYNGATWDRLRSSTANGLVVDASRIVGALPVGANVIGALTANQSVNLNQVAGTGTVNGGLAGSLAIGGTGANNAAITQNPDLIGCESLTYGTQPTASTTGNLRRVACTTEGAIATTPGHNRFSCFVQAVTVTTQCQAAPAAGLRAYILSVALSNQAATVQTLDIIFGTGANCVTAPTALTHKWQFGTVATTTSPFEVSHTFLSPLVPTAANAICVRPSAATAFGATITGYIAP